MINNKSIVAVILLITVTCLSCTKEKIEFKKQHSGSYFNGFASGYSYIIHDESISYYNPNSSEVFGNLFEYQNGRKLGKSVHSLDFFEFENEVYGIITIEGENMIEIIDKNFISVNQITLNSPRNIRVIRDYINGDHILVSYGNLNNGRLAYMGSLGVVFGATNNFEEIHDTIDTGNHPGAIYVHNNYIYVSSTGINVNDSTMAKIYFNGGDLQKVDDIVFGKSPVCLFDYIDSQQGYYNPSLIIQCLGDEIEPSKLFYYSLVSNKILNSFNISNKNPLIQILGLVSEQEFIYKSNNMLYQGSLENLDSTILLTGHNITSLVPNNYRNSYYNNPGHQDPWPPSFGTGSYIGLSAVENEEYSTLYQFNVSMYNKDFFELIDSIPLNKGAKKIVASRPY